MSFDAWTFGTKILPDAAYKFGRGETVMVPAEQVAAEQGIAAHGLVPAKRARAADFMAVTDHAEYMGVINQMEDPTSELSRSDIGKEIIRNPGSCASPIRRGPIHAACVQGGGRRQERSGPWRSRRRTTPMSREGSPPSSPMNGPSCRKERPLHRNVIFSGDHAPAAIQPVCNRRGLRTCGPTWTPPGPGCRCRCLGDPA